MLLAISRTLCTSAFSVCSRQPRRWTPFVRYFTYSLHLCLLCHIVSCVQQVKQTRQIAVYSNAPVVEIWRDAGNHEKQTVKNLHFDRYLSHLNHITWDMFSQPWACFVSLRDDVFRIPSRTSCAFYLLYENVKTKFARYLSQLDHFAC